ncbi:GNAT family N-acetyltransferase [Pseudomonas vanderleydeniana]|uniref:GNAT family N-acetyltransferase n=1 Tax=Pseudomonas vanderleydeniana TaxID=2745495 RepID=A0A9E6PMB7_9PSED|nr:GNAT family N-acetyltransferase [Pseudomonas vanderleydeniana]QXI29542.1 GNAT family N-acetyltransferase [Pseudomonas vanderleydeniana]
MLKPSPLIRTATPEDAPAIEVLYRQLVGNGEVRVLPERLAQLARDPHTELFVAELEGQVRATALLSLCSDAMFGFQPFAVLENVVVDEQVRGTGVGSALLVAVEAFCLRTDCSKIMLLSSIGREPAHRFFQRARFVGDAKRGFVKYRRAFQSS